MTNVVRCEQGTVFKQGTKNYKESYSKKELDNSIKILKNLRAADFSRNENDRLFSDHNLSAFKGLILKLGQRLLKVNVLEQQGNGAYQEALHKFDDLVEQLMDCSFYNLFLSFASQLLQYYTISIDPIITQKDTVDGFTNFLNKRVKKFGNTKENLFIIEYKLILLFNELGTLTDRATGKIATYTTEVMMEHATQLLTHLNTLRNEITTLQANYPTNAFIAYLSFSSNYSCAKGYELIYKMSLSDSNTSNDVRTGFGDIQNLHLEAAGRDLEIVSNLLAKANPDDKAPNGLEFALGQDLFSKLPVRNIDNARNHIASLLR